MTVVERVARPRYDGEGTPFLNWIRNQPGLESNTRVGYVGTDVDLAWYNYRLALIMLLEEKRFMGKRTSSQNATQSVLDQALRFAFAHPDFTLRSTDMPIPPKVSYCGYHLLQFERSGPEDGKIYLDYEEITLEHLRSFLRFEWTPTIQVYRTLADELNACYSFDDLAGVMDDIKRIVPATHPEFAHFKALSYGKVQDIIALEELLTGDHTETEEEY